MGSPKYWLAMPIVAPAMQITTETWNHLRHPSSEFMSLLKITVCICMNVITLFIQGTVALGSLRSFKNIVFTVGHIWSNPSLICHIITTNKLSILILDAKLTWYMRNQNIWILFSWQTWSSDMIWSRLDAKYLVVELEGPVVDVDLLKLEVVNEVLEHVRHPAKL